MEPSEIPEFRKQQEEAGEGGESLTKISLAISILAVLVAMVTVLGHRSHTEGDPYPGSCERPVERIPDQAHTLRPG